MQDHLFQTLTLIESEFPNYGVLVTGDFNRLNVSRLLNHFCLKAIVKIPTRNEAIVCYIPFGVHCLLYTFLRNRMKMLKSTSFLISIGITIIICFCPE